LPPSSSVSALSVAAGASHHGAPRPDAADEADLRHLSMRDERHARVATTRDDVEHAGWKHAVPELGDAQRRQRRLIRRLDDERVAGGERRAALARREEQRMIERADPADHPERLAQRVVEGAGADRDRAALDLGDEAGKVFHVGRADLDVEAHRLEGISGVERFEPGELVGIVEQDRGGGAYRLCPFLRGSIAPRPEGTSRGRDRAIDIFRRRVDGRAERFSGRRRRHGNRAPAVGIVPTPAVVQAPMPRQARVDGGCAASSMPGSAARGKVAHQRTGHRARIFGRDARIDHGHGACAHISHALCNRVLECFDRAHRTVPLGA
jgi:hypothetical protein